MRPPNPLTPQGAFQQQSKTKSAVRIAILSIVAVHAIFFAGLLSLSFVQGCKPNQPNLAEKSPEMTNLESGIPPIRTNFPDTGMDLSVSTSNRVPPFAVQPIPTSPPTQIAPPFVATEVATDYVVRKGDLLGNIAKTHGVTITAITKANPGLVADRIHVGQRIHIPAPGATATPAASRNDVVGSDGVTIHIVKGGENLTKIAKESGASVKMIKDANQLKTDRINVGDKLKIPTGTMPMPAEPMPLESTSPGRGAGSASTAVRPASSQTPARGSMDDLPPISLPQSTSTPLGSSSSRGSAP